MNVFSQIMKSTFAVCMCACTLGLVTRISGQNLPDMDRISYLLEIFCPGDGICLSNHTVQVDPDTDVASCCSSCSCHDDCYLSNCCFPKSSNFEKIPETVKSTGLLHRTCISPFTVDYDDTLSYAVDSYHMITSEILEESPAMERSMRSMTLSSESLSVTSRRLLSLSDNGQSTRQLRNLPPPSADGQPAETVDICGDKVVAPWGSLYPVYSKEKDLIFKNSICAEAYNVTDGITWTPILLCKDNSLVIDMSIYINADMKILPKECFLYFQPPEHDIKSHVCYIEERFIKTCPETSPQTYLDPPFSLYRDEIVAACTSGLLSPVRYHQLYANVFCYICNEQYSYEPNSCPKNDMEWKRTGGASKFGFVGLLNVDVLNPDKEEKLPTKMTCMGSHTEVVKDTLCREILCPSGKTRGIDGVCQFTAKKWYNDNYDLLVNISSPHGLNTRILENNINALVRKWPKTWHIFEVLKALEHKRKAIVSSLVIHFRIPYLKEDPKQLIQTIDNVMSRQWGMYHLGHTYKLDASIGKWKEYTDNFDSSNIMTFSNTPSNKTMHIPAFYQIYYHDNNMINTVGFYITRLNFCEQVELQQPEFIVNDGPDKLFLYNKLTGKCMYDGEFTIVYKGDVRVARICLDSSGLMNSARKTNNSTTVVLMILASVLSIGIMLSMML